jgi:dolichol-phosphate mannosyltransferase
MNDNFAVVVPMANEGSEFAPFISALTAVLDQIGSGRVYLVVDKVSIDNTLDLCRQLSLADKRFTTVWAPENRNVVDAYMKGYREAANGGHRYIIEMDAGLSHDPASLPAFLKALNEGNECVFGSRFIKGGAIDDSSWKRTFLSRFGTILSNMLLGTTMHDMTSGYQGFHADVVKKFLNYRLLSKAHFYQTELRYLLRNTRYTEIPIHYRAPSPGVSKNSITNSMEVLAHYFFLRITNRAPVIK